MLHAARFYELQAPGLGDDFINKIDSAVHDIAENPERCRKKVSGTFFEWKPYEHLS